VVRRQALARRRGLGLGLPQTRLKEPIAGRPVDRDDRGMEEPLIYRAEVVALLFNVADIAAFLTELGKDDGEEDDEG
jgi:hypothetical protein